MGGNAEFAVDVRGLQVTRGKTAAQGFDQVPTGNGNAEEIRGAFVEMPVLREGTEIAHVGVDR